MATMADITTDHIISDCFGKCADWFLSGIQSGEDFGIAETNY